MIRHVIMLMLLLAGASAWAQVADPTVPPAALQDWEKKQQQEKEGDAEAPPPPEQRLQSVLISPKRRIAVIDGKTVREGGKHQGALLAVVRESYVILQKEGGVRETLRLYAPPEQKAGANHTDKRQK